jgi:hypothetical protein
MSVRTPLPARAETPIEDLRVASYTVPTDAAEGDETLRWDATSSQSISSPTGTAEAPPPRRPAADAPAARAAGRWYRAPPLEVLSRTSGKDLR